jgi:hypothetical protein
MLWMGRGLMQVSRRFLVAGRGLQYRQIRSVGNLIDKSGMLSCEFSKLRKLWKPLRKIHKLSKLWKLRSWLIPQLSKLGEQLLGNRCIRIHSRNRRG